MSDKIVCACGKQYPWTPALAGKRGKCGCGRILAFPAQLTPDAPPADDYSSPAALDVQTPPPSTSAAAKAPLSIWGKLGLLALGLVSLGWNAGRPMLEVLQHKVRVAVSFRLILLSSMLTAMALLLLVQGDQGVPAGKPTSQPGTRYRKALAVGAMGAGGLLVGLIWLFFYMHGYSVKF
jgi:hypothetical protein